MLEEKEMKEKQTLIDFQMIYCHVVGEGNEGEADID